MSSKYDVFINGFLSPGAEFTHRTYGEPPAQFGPYVSRYDPLDLGKSLTSRRHLVLSSTTPGRQCPGGRTIAHPLDRSAAYGYRVPFADFWCRHGCSVGVRNRIVQVELHVRHPQHHPSDGLSVSTSRIPNFLPSSSHDK